VLNRPAIGLAALGGAALVVLAAGPVFVELGERSGVAGALRNARTAEKHQIETMAGGVAALDYDGDGRPDLFFSNGAPQPSLRKGGPEWWNRLYRNSGEGRFEDVTAKAGVAGEGYSFGVATGDYDNDGHADLFVAGVERNILYRNRGDGTFEDITKKARVPHTGWAIAAGFFDYDRDGDLDLFIVNYVKWDPKTEPFCGDMQRGYRTYCHPKYYENLPNVLLRNNGDGTFSDVSAESGVGRHAGKGMAVVFGDIDNDGLPDIFVTNDTTPNFLFRNLGGGRFEEIAAQAGLALNDDGRALSSMGADFRDVDNDGRDDIFVTALANETHPLYRNLGRGLFADVTYPSRIGAATMALSGWGGGVYDLDNDGLKDIFCANGDVNDNTELFSSRKSKQQSLVLWQKAGLKFEAEHFGAAAWHRGAAFADFDGDGAVDIVASRIDERPALWLNRAAAGRNWLRVKLEGVKSNRDGLGARVRVATAAGEQWNHATTSVGYASASEKVVHFGLGAQKLVKTVEVRWPSGKTQTLENVSVNQALTVREP
jgi:hypothetical protein